MSWKLPTMTRREDGVSVMNRSGWRCCTICCTICMYNMINQANPNTLPHTHWAIKISKTSSHILTDLHTWRKYKDTIDSTCFIYSIIGNRRVPLGNNIRTMILITPRSNISKRLNTCIMANSNLSVASNLVAICCLVMAICCLVMWGPRVRRDLRKWKTQSSCNVGLVNYWCMCVWECAS